MPRASPTDPASSLALPPSDPEALRASILLHAEWLRREAPLLQALGLRPQAENVVELGPIALSRVSEAHRRESDERRRLEAVARANYAAQAQTHAAVIDLMDSESLEDMPRRLDELARVRFGLALGAIAIEGPGAAPPGWIALVEGQVDAILGSHRLSRLVRCPTAAGLFGAVAPQIGSAALLRLQLWRPERQGVIAFGAFDPAAFAPDMGAELVTFLARVVERTAERWQRP